MSGFGGAPSGAILDVMAVPGDVYERNQEATIYVGNVDAKIDEEILWELFIQAGPLQTVNTPKDKITGQHMGYAFIEFKNEEDADYACKIMNMVKLFNKPIRCTKATADKKTQDIGANLFVGNLDPTCDDKTLYDTFASFGQLLFAKIMRDPDPPYTSRGFGFVSYDSFDSSDAAMAGMNGQFLCNSPVMVSYAYKKDTRGERHGDAAERLIAAHKPTQIPQNHIPAPEGLASGRGLALPDGPAPMIHGRLPGMMAAQPPPLPGGKGMNYPPAPPGTGPGGGKQWGKGW